MKYTILEISAILNPVYTHIISDTTIQYLLTDSRNLTFPASTLFFAIKSDLRDGHDYISDLYMQGNRNFVISTPIDINKYPEANFLTVENSLTALQQLAAYGRSHFQLPVIGITGSNGKTIVKEWLNQLLATEFAILRSPRSYNSQIGVPMSVWELNNDYNLAIFEAGISQTGEMENLEKIIHPTIGILTNIGSAHDEGFNSREEKIKEKLKLFPHANILFLNGDDTQTFHLAQQLDIELFTWGRSSNCILQIKHIQIIDSKHTTIAATYHSEEVQITIPFTDEASISDAIICWSILLFLHIEHNSIKEKFLSLRALDMRLQVLTAINNCTIINDSYSFDVNSLSIALDFLGQQKISKTVIISDLAYNDTNNYIAIANLLRNKHINRVIAIGTQWMEYQQLLNSGITQVETFPSIQEFLQQINLVKFNQEALLLKGARKYHFERIVPLLQEKIHQTHLEINMNALAHNLKQYRNYIKPTTKIMAMVKAYGYGSGSIEVSTLMQYYHVDYLTVAYADEGVALRKSGISTPIVIMNVDEYSFSTLLAFHLEPNIFSFKIYDAFHSYLQQEGITNYPIHFKIDTGMHRLGFEEEEITTIATKIKTNNTVVVKSAFTHFVASEDPQEDDFSKYQFELYLRCADNLESILNYKFIRHISNSSAIVRFPQYQLDMVRLGIGLYGVDSSGLKQQELEPVSTLLTTIAQIHYIKAGDTVSYNRRGIVNRDSTIATIRIGYADGLNRKLGYSNGSVYINGCQAPILGTICMDMCMVDITDIPNVNEGDTVEIFGKNIPVQEVAKKIGTIPYEVLTGIGERIPRVYVEE